MHRVVNLTFDRTGGIMRGRAVRMRQSWPSAPRAPPRTVKRAIFVGVRCCAEAEIRSDSDPRHGRFTGRVVAVRQLTTRTVSAGNAGRWQYCSALFLLCRLPTEFIRWSGDSSLNLAARGTTTSELARWSGDSSLNLATRGAAAAELARWSSDSSLNLATRGTTTTEQARRGRW